MDLSKKESTLQRKLMSKAVETNSDPYSAILEYQNTPIDDGQHSPDKLLMSCQFCSILPVISSQLEPKTVPYSLFEVNKQ